MTKKKKISVQAAKSKGRRLQQWVASILSKITGIPWGADELISSRAGGQAGTDVLLIGKAAALIPFDIECKYQETFSIPAWIKQAKDNTKDGRTWLLVCKKNFTDPIVVIDAVKFFELFDRLLHAEGDL